MTSLLSFGFGGCGVQTVLQLIVVVTLAAAPAASHASPNDDLVASETAHEAEVPDESARTILLRGKILDSAARPLATARFYLTLDPWAEPIELGVSRDDGAYRFEVPEKIIRTKLWAGSRFDRCRAALIATAPGCGPAWEELPDVQGGRYGEMRPEYVRDFHLSEDYPIAGRVVDSSGKPVVGAEVSVAAIHDLADGRWFKLHPAIEANKPDSLTRDEIDTNNWATPLYPTTWNVIPAAKSDSDGRFRLTGAGGDRAVQLRVDGPGIVAKEYFSVITRDDVAEFTRLTRAKYPGKDGVQIYDPAPIIEVDRGRTIAGTVRDPRTGKPIRLVRINANTFTDARGHFRMPTGDTSHYLVTADMGGEFYLNSIHTFPRSAADEVVADIEMPRGVVLSGRVLEAGSDRPLPSAPRHHCHDIGPGPVIAGRVSYLPLSTNVASRGTPAGKYYETYPAYYASARIDAEGRFKLAVPPGPGVLLVYANPGMSDMFQFQLAKLDDYPQLLPFALLSSRSRDDGAADDDPATLPGFSGRIDVTKFHGYQVINPSADEAEVDLTLTIPRAPTRTLRFVDPTGRPIEGLTIQGVAEPLQNSLVDFGAEFGGSEVEIVGLSAARPRRVVTASKDGKYVGINYVRTDDPQPRTVTLQEAAAVAGRLIDAKTTRPLAGYTVRFNYPIQYNQVGNRLSYGGYNSVKTDADGRFRIGRAFAGVAQGISFEAPPDPNLFGATSFEPAAAQNLLLAAGEVRDLGEIAIDPTVGKDVAASGQD